MNALAYIRRELQKAVQSPMEAEEILARIPAKEIQHIQTLLDSFLFTPAKRHAAGVIESALAEHVPHELCEKRHFMLSLPVLKLALHMHRKLGVHPVVGKYAACFGVVFAGAYMATHPIQALPHAAHFIWDGIGYTIHGIGAAPVAEAVLRKLQKRRKEEDEK
jgi:hypothetical protein